MDILHTVSLSTFVLKKYIFYTAKLVNTRKFSLKLIKIYFLQIFGHLYVIVMVFLGLSDSNLSKHYLIFEFQWNKFGFLPIFIKNENFLIYSHFLPNDLTADKKLDLNDECIFTGSLINLH